MGLLRHLQAPHSTQGSTVGFLSLCFSLLEPRPSPAAPGTAELGEAQAGLLRVPQQLLVPSCDPSSHAAEQRLAGGKLMGKKRKAMD